MKRDEQISEAANTYAPFDVASVNSVARAFYDGAKWADANPISMWRSVEDELPEDYVTVLINCEYGRCLGAYDRQDEEWYIDGYGVAEDATHWMPIPELKKGGDND